LKPNVSSRGFAATRPSGNSKIPKRQLLTLRRLRLRAGNGSWSELKAEGLSSADLLED